MIYYCHDLHSVFMARKIFMLVLLVRITNQTRSAHQETHISGLFPTSELASEIFRKTSMNKSLQ